jgi:hypothetical protein
MATEFKLPDLGENIASGDVVTVFVSAGDVVKPGQAILEVETDKAVIEVPCPPGGRVASVLVKKGDTVMVGQALVMRSLPEPRPTFVHLRGDYLNPDTKLGPLAAGTPAFLPPLGASDGRPTTRLGS